MNIILVHLGNKKIRYINYCIDQILRFNKGINIHLISQKQTYQYININLKKKIIFHDCEKIQISDHHKEFKRKNNLDYKWYNGFWLHTTERFFYLENIINKLKLKNVFHIENDCLLYFSLKKYKKVFEKNFNISFIPESNTKVIPVIIYIKNYHYIKKINQFILNEFKFLKLINIFYLNKKKINDMLILNKFFKKNYKKLKILNLPTSINNNFKNFSKDNDYNFNNCFKKFNGIFDPSYLGLTLDGFDRSTKIFKNVKVKPFLNPPFELSNTKIIFKKKNKLKIPYLKQGNRYIKIYNLHIHSKRLKKFLS